MFVAVSWLHLLWNDDSVARLQFDILVLIVALEDFPVIKGQFRMLAIDKPHDVDLFYVGKGRKSAGVGERLQNGGSRNQREGTRAKHFTDHKYALAIDLGDDHGDLRFGQEFPQLAGYIRGQLLGRHAGSLHVVDQRQRNFSVGPHRNDAGSCPAPSKH